MDQTFRSTQGLGASQYPYTQAIPTTPGKTSGSTPGRAGDPNTPNPGFGSDTPKPGFDYAEAVRPATIYQITHATRRNPDAYFQIGGRDVYHVSLVAQVLLLGLGTTGCKFVLDDSTGQIMANMWFSKFVPDVLGNHGIDVSEREYARVIGTVDTFNERIQLRVRFIRRIGDSHEIFRHLLEVMVLEVKLGGMARRSMGEGAGAGAGAGVGVDASARVGAGANVGVGSTAAPPAVTQPQGSRPSQQDSRPSQQDSRPSQQDSRSSQQDSYPPQQGSPPLRPVAPTSRHVHDIPSTPPPRYISNLGSQNYASGSQDHASGSQATPVRRAPSPTPAYQERDSSPESSASRRRRPRREGSGREEPRTRSPTLDSSDDDSTDYLSMSDVDSSPLASRSNSPAPLSPPITPQRPPAKVRFTPAKDKYNPLLNHKHKAAVRDPLSHLTTLERAIYQEIARCTEVRPIYPNPSDSQRTPRSHATVPGAYTEDGPSAGRRRGKEWVSWLQLIREWGAGRRPDHAEFAEALDSLKSQGLIEVDDPEDAGGDGWLKIIA